jgi:hypothetical protein
VPLAGEDIYVVSSREKRRVLGGTIGICTGESETFFAGGKELAA